AYFLAPASGWVSGVRGLLCLTECGGEWGSILRSLAAGRTPGLRARVGLRSPRIPSSFARPELRCSRRPERRGRAALGGPGGGPSSPSRSHARHRRRAEPPGGFPAGRPGRPNHLALCSPRARPQWRLLCGGFGARPPPANAGARPGACGVGLRRVRGCSGLTYRLRLTQCLKRLTQKGKVSLHKTQG
uniref:Uncharacterized protein n=1 Tax=Felis catus TaxID=9685 RepID=A0ABI7VZ80_FELCA